MILLIFTQNPIKLPCDVGARIRLRCGWAIFGNPLEIRFQWGTRQRENNVLGFIHGGGNFARNAGCSRCLRTNFNDDVLIFSRVHNNRRKTFRGASTERKVSQEPQGNFCLHIRRTNYWNTVKNSKLTRVSEGIVSKLGFK